MDNTEIVKRLTRLAQLDIDAVYAYEQALKYIDSNDVYKNINSFMHDHLRHIDNLNSLIKAHGGDPLEKTQDFKGYLIEGMTMIRSITGTAGALEGMKTNENLTNRVYKEALLDGDDLPEDVIRVIEANYDDEKRHLRYIKEALEMLEKV